MFSVTKQFSGKTVYWTGSYFTTNWLKALPLSRDKATQIAIANKATITEY